MKKLIVLLIFAFLTTSAMANTLSQSDFYGTWKFTDNNETIVCIITHNSWTVIIDNEEPITVNILTWERVDNSSIKTFQIFPFGFRITIQQLNGNVASTILYINQEKRHIIIPEFLGEVVLTKQ